MYRRKKITGTAKNNRLQHLKGVKNMEGQHIHTIYKQQN